MRISSLNVYSNHDTTGGCIKFLYNFIYVKKISVSDRLSFIGVIYCRRFIIWLLPIHKTLTQIKRISPLSSSSRPIFFQFKFLYKTITNKAYSIISFIALFGSYIYIYASSDIRIIVN